MAETFALGNGHSARRRSARGISLGRFRLPLPSDKESAVKLTESLKAVAEVPTAMKALTVAVAVVGIVALVALVVAVSGKAVK